jgi:hypothetical protein
LKGVEFGFDDGSTVGFGLGCVQEGEFGADVVLRVRSARGEGGARLSVKRERAFKDDQHET